jgi:hypothetical protein
MKLSSNRNHPANCSTYQLTYLRFRRGDCHVNRANAAQEDSDRNAEDTELVQHRIGASDLKQEDKTEIWKSEQSRHALWL